MLQKFGLALLLGTSIFITASAQDRPRVEALQLQLPGKAQIKAEAIFAQTITAEQFLKSSPEAFRESNKAAPIIVAEKESAYGSRFIVVLNNQQSRLALGKSSSEERVREIANDIVRRSGIRARGDDLTILAGALNGFVIESNPRELAGIAQDPRVLFIEQDSEVTTQDVQTNPNSWGLDRTDQRQLPLNQSFAFDHDVGPLHAYIIDTGVRPSHSDFQQTGGGTRAASVFNSVGGSNDDCNGHGTHVAGTMAGNEYGVAKSANIYGVKVLNCSGGGSVSSVVSGVNYVMNNFQSPGVANMSLGGGLSPALNLSVSNAIAADVPIVVAAGNSNQNAANFSPASVATAITVGSTDINDSRSSYSNWGDLVDVFAPGRNIKSAWHTSNTATNTISGTSMAAPHVAGIALLLAGRDGNKSPANLETRVVQQSTKNVVTDPKSPNRLAYHYPSIVSADLIACREEQVPSKYGSLTVQVFCAGDTVPVEIDSHMSDGLFVGLAEFDPVSWSDITSHHSGWVCAGCTVPSLVAANDYLNNGAGGTFNPGAVYSMKVAVGPVWHSDFVFFKIDPGC